MTRPTSKRAQLAKMISRKSGASVPHLQAKLTWQPHTIRAEISRLRKTGLVVTAVRRQAVLCITPRWLRPPNESRSVNGKLA